MKGIWYRNVGKKSSDNDIAMQIKTFSPKFLSNICINFNLEFLSNLFIVNSTLVYVISLNIQNIKHSTPIWSGIN